MLRGDCNFDLGDGCETDLTLDEAYCGQRGLLCNPGLVCVDGLCIP